MTALLSIRFQAEPQVYGRLQRDELSTLRREAFPRCPAPDAIGDPDWRSYKLVPLSTGRLALSVTMDCGDDDEFGRPVLRARACVLDRHSLCGAWRDPVAIWRALEELDPRAGQAGLAAAVESRSVLASDTAFERLAAAYDRHGRFYGKAAQALGQPEVNLYLPRGRAAATRLRPALLLLPLSRLAELHLATGSGSSGDREEILGLEGGAPSDPRPQRRGLLGGWLSRGAAPQPTVQVDMVEGAVRGVRGPGPLHLARLAAEPEPWPGLSPRQRFSLLLACMDGPARGEADTSPFDRVPELAAMRRLVGEVEAVSAELVAWR